MPFSRYQNLSQLKKNILSGSVLAGTNVVLMLVAYPIYLKYLGTELYGLWAAVSVVVSFSRLGELGVNNALIKYVAEEFGEGNYCGITEYITASICILVVPSILIISLLTIFTTKIIALLSLSQSYINQAEKLLPLVGFLSIFILFTEMVKGIIMGVGRVDIANYIFLAGRVIQVAVSVMLAFKGIGVWAMYWGTLFSYLVVFIAYLFILIAVHKVKLLSKKGLNKHCFYNLLNFGGTMFLARIVSMLTQPFNKVMISRYIGLSEVAYYEIALRGVANLRGLYEMGLKAIMPKISELMQKVENPKMALTNIYQKSVKVILIFALPAFIGLFVLSEIALSFWLGGRYNPQISTALRWLLFAYYINLLAVPSYYISMGTGKVRYCLINHLSTAVFNVVIITSFVALGVISFQLFVGIQAFSVIVASIILILQFSRYRKKRH